jgi:hypothetical protein
VQQSESPLAHLPLLKSMRNAMKLPVSMRCAR